MIDYFPEAEASKMSTSRRSLVCGVGTNDAKYTVTQKINGKRKTCPFYRKWHGMIERCYNIRNHKRYPTYARCTVTKEWLTFSNFKLWMEKQDWKGRHLDKDIIKPNNKVYSPDSCCFISQSLNKLLTNSLASRGDYPQGVNFSGIAKRFVSRCKVDGERTHLGYFDTAKEASKVYNKFKQNLIIVRANQQTDTRIKNGLIEHAKSFN